MAATLFIILLFSFILTATTDDISDGKGEKSKDILLQKVTRELLLLELNDLKNEILQRDVSAKNNDIAKLASVDKEVSDLIEARSESLTKQRADNVKKASKSDEEDKREASLALDDTSEIAKLQKRLMDLSQGRNNVMGTCSDEFGMRMCQKLQQKNPKFCKYVGTKCRKTCGECGQFDVYPSFCKNFAGKCHEKSAIGVFLREKCRKTCGGPSSLKHNCTDDKNQAKSCLKWKSKGLCKTERDVMMSICKATCNFC